jgi:hypothetical protein
MKRRYAAIIVAIVGLLSLVWGVLYLLKSPIPSEIRHKTAFPIFYPAHSGTSLKVDKDTLKYDDANHGLSYAILLNGKKIVITEQATPDSFADGPVYSYLLQKSHTYDSVDTQVGKVSLTRPQELNGGQAAVVNPPGTLVFGRPNKDLNKNEWKQVFNAMEKQ